jgi:hypothetical protein
VGIETFIDEAEKLKLYPGSYFRRIPDGFEVKATYLRGQKNALLRFWMDIDASGASNAGMIPFIVYLMGNDHNLRVEFSGDQHTFDYEWLNRGYFEKQGYFRYGAYYDFYKQD